MPAEKFGQPPPLAQAMLLADAIHRDPATKKFFILGTYNMLGCPKFPTPPNPLRVYVSMTDMHGQTPVRIRVTDMDEMYGTLCEKTLVVDCPDPNLNVELVFTPDPVFPEPGMYRIQLFADHELLRELRLRLLPNRLVAQPPINRED
ncbi:MAG TPA: hypothetical protein VE999_20840 [Gemmataceae bacterium]|nr:hypothetical protein [Gemmataceae bacterium]